MTQPVKKEIQTTVIAIVVTGAFSTASTVTALNVHLGYLQTDINKIEVVNGKQDEQIRLLQITQAANSAG